MKEVKKDNVNIRFIDRLPPRLPKKRYHWEKEEEQVREDRLFLGTIRGGLIHGLSLSDLQLQRLNEINNRY